jgi:ribosome maturation factor RimP
MFKRLFFLCSTVWETQTFTLGGFDSIRQLTTLGRFPVILNRENCFFLHVTEGDIPENSGNTRHDGKHLPEIEDDALGNITHWTTDVESVICKCAESLKLHTQSIAWRSDRIEITLAVSNDPLEEAFPSIDQIQRAHLKIFEALEMRESELRVVSRYEISVASPGISDDLRSNRDFLTFKGFPVSVTTKEVFKKRTLFEGTLLERTEETVNISQKGRIIKIPRNLVVSVCLPKAKFEPNDSEATKFR